MWFDLGLALVVYVLAIFTWPHLRHWLLQLRTDPVALIERDIATLRAQADKLRAR